MVVSGIVFLPQSCNSQKQMSDLSAEYQLHGAKEWPYSAVNKCLINDSINDDLSAVDFLNPKPLENRLAHVEKMMLS